MASLKRIITEPPWSTREPLDGELVLRGRTATELWGFGQHPATSLCLSILTGLYSEFGPRPKHVIELNCGSGLLCIAAAKLGAESATGLENETAAREIAVENALLNRANARFLPLPDEQLSAAGSSYDLAIANLTAQELSAAKERLAKLVPKGHLLIAGFVEEEREALEQQVLALGFRLLYREARGGFIASVLKARAADLRGSA